MLFQKFGEMGSYEEINSLAENLKREGDFESLKELAIENGIDAEEAEDFYDGAKECLIDNALMAALGKIDVEEKELSINGEDILKDWVDYIRTKCTESELMQKAVRSKEKSLKGCLGQLIKWGFEHQMSIDREIIKAAGVNASKVTSGTPNMKTAKLIITRYYCVG